MAGEPDFNPIFRIYPVGVEFTAEYTESSYTESFTNEDCTVVTDSNGIECYQYQIGTYNTGTLVITVYGKEYQIGTYFGGPEYWNMSLNLYAWTGSLYNATFYTNMETPGSTLMIFNEDGNDVTDRYIDGSDSVVLNSSSEQITIQHADVAAWPVSSITGTGAEMYYRDSTKDILLNIPKPEQLYAYSKESVDMYAWTIEDGSEVTPSSCTTIYTKTSVLDTDNGVFYDENGVEYDTFPGTDIEISTSSVVITGISVTEATAEKITMKSNTPVPS